MSAPIKATFADARRAGFCARGQREWFAARGLDYFKFVEEGIDIEQLRALNDGYANVLILQAEAKHGQH